MAIRAFESLAEMTRSMIGSLEPSQVFRSVVQGAVAVLGADGATLSVFDEASQTLSIAADFGIRNPAGRAVTRWRLGEGLVGYVAQQLEPVFVGNLQEDPRLRNTAWARAEGLHAYGAIPLRVAEGRVIGVLTAFYRRAHAFTPDEIKLLTTLGGLAAVAILNARLHEAAVRHGERLAALLRAARTVMAGLDLKATLERITDEASRIAGTPHVKVLLLDPEAKVLRPAAVAGAPVPLGFEVALGTSLSGVVATTGEPLFLPDAPNDPRNLLRDRDREMGIVTFLGLPIRFGEKVLGVLTFNTTYPHDYAADELAYLGSFADQAAIAIENARLYSDLRRALDALRASQERQIELERLRALGEMASGVAHHFNNMLAAILGRAQLMQPLVADPKIRQGLSTIERLAQGGAQVVRRIQEFTRVRRWRPPGEVRLQEVVADALEFTRGRWETAAQAAGRGYRVETDLGAVPPVLGTASELREALVNIVMNAFDAMPEGGRLRISATATGDRVELRVADSGGGMPEEVRRRALEPFFTTKGPRSSGLGLAVAYGIVERHGGALTIESEPGRGTTVLVALPAATAGRRGLIAPGAAPRLRVLVVEDEEDVRQVLVDALVEWGHEVFVATDGTEGVRLASGGDFDLVLTDLSLPGRSGWAVAEAVRGREKDVPIAFVTGWGEELDPARLAGLGRVEVVSKPFRLDDLAALIARLAS